LLVKSSDLEYLAEYVYPLARAQESLSALVGALAGLILSTLLISPSALSLEGSSISVLRSLPINGKTVMLSKLLPSVIISVPSALVFSVLAAIAAGSPIEYLPSVVLTPIAAAVAFSALGLVMNVAFPNFDFQSEAQPIKQSLAVFLTMTLQFVIAIAATGAAVALLYFVGALAASYALLCIYLALSLLFICILLGKCAKKYERISV